MKKRAVREEVLINDERAQAKIWIDWYRPKLFTNDLNLIEYSLTLIEYCLTTAPFIIHQYKSLFFWSRLIDI